MRNPLRELQQWHEAVAQRDDRIRELKREVNDLLARQNQPPRYPGTGKEISWQSRRLSPASF